MKRSSMHIITAIQIGGFLLCYLFGLRLGGVLQPIPSSSVSGVSGPPFNISSTETDTVPLPTALVQRRFLIILVEDLTMLDAGKAGGASFTLAPSPVRLHTVWWATFTSRTPLALVPIFPSLKGNIVRDQNLAAHFELVIDRKTGEIHLGKAFANQLEAEKLSWEAYIVLDLQALQALSFTHSSSLAQLPLPMWHKSMPAPTNASQLNSQVPIWKSFCQNFLLQASQEPNNTLITDHVRFGPDSDAALALLKDMAEAADLQQPTTSDPQGSCEFLGGPQQK